MADSSRPSQQDRRQADPPGRSTPAPAGVAHRSRRQEGHRRL